jgi:hypothetical protein
MKFLQVIEYTTSRPEEASRLVDEWVARTAGRRTATHGYTGRDRDRPNSYLDVIVFSSYEEAIKNNELPETKAMAEGFLKLCDAPPIFHNLDVARDDDLV